MKGATGVPKRVEMAAKVIISDITIFICHIYYKLKIYNT